VQTLIPVRSNLYTMSATKTYMLVPHYDFPPDGPIVLGSIISNIRDPGDSLNEEDIVEIPESSRHTTHKFDWQHTAESINGGGTGLWARCLSILGFGGNINAHFDSRSLDLYRIRDMETVFFSPSQTYLKQAVNKDCVRQYLEGSLYAPVYIITGLKIVRGPGAEVTKRRSLGGHGSAKFGVPGTVAGFPFAVDTGEVTLHHSGSENTSFGGGSDFVFGYRLGKITFHKSPQGAQVPKHQAYTVGAVLGVKDNPSVKNSPAAITATIEFGGDDAVAQELRGEELIPAIDEDDNQECKCFVVP
jgi:hypothetical protein